MQATIRKNTLSLLMLALSGCAHRSAPSSATEATEAASASAAAPQDAQAMFASAARGGGEVPPEVVQQWAEQDAAIRIVDVREPEELTGELGHIEGVEHVPLAQLAAESASWDKTAPVVLVCKSGKRSAAAVEQLEQQGFTNVVFMTGGMQRWNEQGLPVSR